MDVSRTGVLEIGLKKYGAWRRGTLGFCGLGWARGPSYEMLNFGDVIFHYFQHAVEQGQDMSFRFCELCFRMSPTRDSDSQHVLEVTWCNTTALEFAGAPKKHHRFPIDSPVDLSGK